MGKRGKQYNKTVLFELVEKFLPVSSNDWEKIVPLYKAASKETEERNAGDLARVFQNVANTKKKTGNAAPHPLVQMAADIRKKIDDKSFAGTYGAQEDEDTSSSSDEETPTKARSTVNVGEELFPSTLPDVHDFEENVSSPTANAESGQKRKLPESEDRKSKNSRNNSRVALGSILKDLVEQMKTPQSAPATPAISAPHSLDFLLQENRELRQMNQKLMESNSALMLQLSTLATKDLKEV